MKKPIILITGGRAYDRHFHGLSLTLNKTYTAAVAAAGGIPLLALDPESYDEYAAMLMEAAEAAIEGKEIEHNRLVAPKLFEKQSCARYGK